MSRGLHGAAPAAVLLLAVACGSQTGRAPAKEAIERALFAKEKREPTIAAEQPRLGDLKRIRCRPAGALPGVGQAFFCQVDYQFASSASS